MDSHENEHDVTSKHGGVGTSAIKWSAIVIIVLSVLYFLAQFVIPIFS